MEKRWAILDGVLSISKQDFLRHVYRKAISMPSLQLKLVSFNAVPEHMERLSVIAKSKGLSCAAFLRLMIAPTVSTPTRREVLKAKIIRVWRRVKAAILLWD